MHAATAIHPIPCHNNTQPHCSNSAVGAASQQFTAVEAVEMNFGFIRGIG